MIVNQIERLGLLKPVPRLSLPVGIEKEFRLPEGSRQRFRRRHSATARPFATLSIPARTVRKTPTTQLQHPPCRPALHAGQQLHCIPPFRSATVPSQGFAFL